jgi:hypothetical protein
VALISIAGQPREAGRDVPFAVAGKTLAHRQLDFVLAAGSERVIALGDGASAEAIALRHVAEGAGTRFDVIPDGHRLLGALGASDELLVLAPGVLADSPAAQEMLSKGNKVLVLPAASGIAAGFERIDLERAWAGAMLIPGSLIERLSELPEDSEPTAALLRVALQARMREVRLPDELIDDGSWARVGEETAGSRDPAWLKRNLMPAPTRAVSPWLARISLSLLAAPLLGARQALASVVGAVAVFLVGAVGASAYGLISLGFGLVTLAALSSELTAGLLRLRNAPFPKARGRIWALLPGAVDLALAACASLAIEGDWLHRLFPPLVLLGALHAGRFVERPDWTSLLGDRALLAAVLAVAAVFGATEPAVMLAALLAIALNLANSRVQRG